mmetsp:Transcript_128191/g.358878  ORF Transcript_128191/g.358878 Transcript_128191/m.358878 type:complete len:668 (+) Transcript_128191:1274-3277(+)
MLASLTASLEARLELALPGGDDENADVSLGRAADHVRHVGLVAGGVQDGESSVRRLEVRAPDLHRLAFRLLLVARVHDIGEKPTLAVLVLGLLHVLLDGSLVDAAGQVQDVAARRGLPGIDVADEHDVQMRPRVRLRHLALALLGGLDDLHLVLLLFCIGRRLLRLDRLLRRGRRSLPHRSRLLHLNRLRRLNLHGLRRLGLRRLLRRLVGLLLPVVLLILLFLLGRRRLSDGLRRRLILGLLLPRRRLRRRTRGGLRRGLGRLPLRALRPLVFIERHLVRCLRLRGGLGLLRGLLRLALLQVHAAAAATAATTAAFLSLRLPPNLVPLVQLLEGELPVVVAVDALEDMLELRMGVVLLPDFLGQTEELGDVAALAACLDQLSLVDGSVAVAVALLEDLLKRRRPGGGLLLIAGGADLGLRLGLGLLEGHVPPRPRPACLRQLQQPIADGGVPAIGRVARLGGRLGVIAAGNGGAARQFRSLGAAELQKRRHGRGLGDGRRGAAFRQPMALLPPMSALRAQAVHLPELLLQPLPEVQGVGLGALYIGGHVVHKGLQVLQVGQLLLQAQVVVHVLQALRADALHRQNSGHASGGRRQHGPRQPRLRGAARRNGVRRRARWRRTPRRGSRRNQQRRRGHRRQQRRRATTERGPGGARAPRRRHYGRGPR